MTKIIVASYLILSCALFVYHSNIKAEANGRITNYQTQKIDLYIVKFGTIPPSPQIGKTHFSIQIIDSNTNTSISDLDIYVALKIPDTDDWIPPQRAYISPFDSSAYEFNHKFEVPGNWQIKILINDPNSQNDAVFELFVKQFSALPGILTLIFLIVLASTFAYIIRIKLTQKSRRI
jgi:hypothetical protein